jgi:hypothetical protein
MPADRARKKVEADASPEAESPDEAEVPLNRAERRGHGKGTGRTQAAGHGKVSGRSSRVQGPRMWSNRRGGS